ncbi:MAG: O-acetyl-ADP-ribose deacetylase [Anaerolineae bacterium]|jgi:O-acetyl-ADP-ribose deacetylase (regulator of RNase III)
MSINDLPARVQINQSVLELVEGDITQQETEAIVNAANSSLLGGGGVDGAIHRAAGPELLAECRTLGGCPVGEARLTRGYRLKAKYVIHGVGPVYHGEPRDAELLASVHRHALQLASEHGIASVAFPAISTGVYGYPMEEAAPIALQTAIDYLRDHPEIKLVRFVLFPKGDLRVGQRAYQTYTAALKTLMSDR